MARQVSVDRAGSLTGAAGDRIRPAARTCLFGGVSLEELVDLGVVDAGEGAAAQRDDMSDAGRRQQDSSGQRDTARCVVSRPRNHLACTKGTPTLIENSPASVAPVWVAHQNVPAGVSVYW